MQAEYQLQPTHSDGAIKSTGMLLLPECGWL
jgi:hypothetical protein